jgi:hypothetical protein
MLAGVADVLPADEEGFTFNPSTNLAAALVSQSQKGRRFDRILIRSPGYNNSTPNNHTTPVVMLSGIISVASEGRSWHPVRIGMVATEPIVWKEKRRPKRSAPLAWSVGDAGFIAECVN